MKINFFCDESGAKGFADNDERYPGEVGVFAGIVVPEELMRHVQPDFDGIVDRFNPAQGKLHVADLGPAAQQELREAIYATIRMHDLPCFWYAIHVSGLHACHRLEDAFVKSGQRPTVASQRFKGRSPRPDPRSLHVALFDGLYAHLVAFLDERLTGPVDIAVRTDRVDAPVAKAFREAAEELLSSGPSVIEETRFDVQTGEVVSGSIRFAAVLPSELDLNIAVQRLSIEPVEDHDGLVLAADVLANSLYHLFKSRSADELYGPLNRPDAVARHPLATQLDRFGNWGGPDLIGDGLFRHPKAPESTSSAPT